MTPRACEVLVPPSSPFAGVPKVGQDTRPSAAPPQQPVGLTPAQEQRIADLERFRRGFEAIQRAQRRHELGLDPFAPPGTTIVDLINRFNRDALVALGLPAGPAPGGVSGRGPAGPGSGVIVNPVLRAEQLAREARDRNSRENSTGAIIDRNIFDPIPVENEALREFLGRQALEKPIEAILDVGFVSKKVFIQSAGRIFTGPDLGVFEERNIAIREAQEHALHAALNLTNGVAIRVLAPERADPPAMPGPATPASSAALEPDEGET